MATVYLCEDLQGPGSVAVKVLRREIGSAVVVERFLREIEFASRLDHARIPRVLDSGTTTDGTPFYVMTFIEGESLRDLLDRVKQLPIDEALKIAAAVMEPMTYAHRMGIVHRDIKPGNIIIGVDGVHVLDFGIARAIVASAEDRLTSTGIAIGTPAYMSPEQALGDGDLDARSDIYSLGCVIYEMIAGIPPFVGATAQAVMSRRFAAPAPPLSETRDGVPPHIEAAVAKALNRSPADRWQTAASFAQALYRSDLLGKSDAILRTRLRSRRRSLAYGLVFSAVGGAGLAAALFASQSSQSANLDPRRVAVLYFDDHSEGMAHEYIAHGLTVSLIGELTKVPTLKVIPLQGVKRYRNQAVPIDSIASQLQAGSIVQGTVQQSGGKIQVTAQFIDGLSGINLEQTTIRRDTGEVLELERMLATQVATMLRRRIGVQMRVGETAKATRNPRVRDLVFRADRARADAEIAANGSSEIERVRGLQLLTLADSLLAEAESAERRWIGPTVRRGWIALDLAQRQVGEKQTEAFRTALHHANRAIDRQPRSALGLHLRGTIKYYTALLLPQPADSNQTLKEAESDLVSAIRQDEDLPNAYGTLSRTQIALSKLDDAQINASKAVDKDAFLQDAATILLSGYAATLMAGNRALAWKWCEEGAREFPNNARFLECQLTLLAEDLDRKPDPARAWSLVRRADQLDPPVLARRAGRALLPPYRQMQAAIVSARDGARDSALAVAARVREQTQRDPELARYLSYEEAFLHLCLGDRKTAISLISRYASERRDEEMRILTDPRWKQLLDDPTFRSIFSRGR